MDPVTVLSMVGACLTIVTRTTSGTNELATKFQNLEQKVNLIIARLNTITATMTQLERWLRGNQHDMTSNMVDDLTRAVSSCTIVVREIENYVANVKGGRFGGRFRYLWDESQFLQYQSALDSQVTALALFLNVMLLNSNIQRQAVLENSDTRYALQEAQDQASMCSSGSRPSIGTRGSRSSISSNDTNSVSSFSFDDELIDSEPYRAAFRRIMSMPSPKKARGTGESPAERSPSYVMSTTLQGSMGSSSQRKSWATSASSVAVRELCMAASLGDLEAVQKLVKDVNVNTRCELEAKDKHSIKGLLSSNKLEPTALHYAAANEHADVVKTLVDSGADVHARVRGGKMPLHVSKGAAVAVLVSLRADPLSRDDAGATPLHYLAAAAGGRRVGEQGEEEGGEHPNAAAARSLVAASPLAAHATTTKRRLTPLHIASQHNNVDVTAVLVSARAYVDAADTTGLRPLHCAAEYGHPALISLLLSAGANAEPSAGRDMWRPLHHAAHRGHAEAVTALLGPAAGTDEAGASSNAGTLNLEAPTADQRRALHLAVSSGSANTVDVLLAAGADVEALTARRERSLQLALRLLQSAPTAAPDVVRALLRHGADVEASRALVAACGAVGPALQLLEAGAAPNGSGKDGEATPLLAACSRAGDALDVVRLLVGRGAAPSHQDFCAVWRNERLKMWEKKAVHAAMNEVAREELRRDEVEWLMVAR
ncbi:uncharacterized protein K452DRAFT_314969 [Aplosporella prunicola CBS 121167]|uniref:Uncharacterized protein n=1 Tax=Aplosporella prunicola CBS 121167 TaxID=1176127 RepID=A0A6A6BRL9_9PEZI|nr:uncharacterized protein K452DRAFT_314969 [Aplosporella prunicola CBS 121167]KAF2146739.1 hypothetical protein K452DRAFT_314969 [Aplosporella prunicola CBS 121167]